MKITPKTIRVLFIFISIFAVVIIGYAAMKILAGPKTTVDEQGCIWDELTPLQLSEYNDGSKNYQVRSENGKHYLLRECRGQ